MKERIIVTALLAWALVGSLGGCAAMPQLFERTTEVSVPVPVGVDVPAELVQPFRPTVRPIFTDPRDPAAVVGLTEMEARALRQFSQELYDWGAACRVYLREHAVMPAE